MVYNTGPVLTSKQLSIEFARQTSKFGYGDSFRAGKTLNIYDESHLKGIFRQLGLNNLLL